MEPGDVADQIVLDIAEAWARAVRGERAAAVALLARAREAVERIDLASAQGQVDYIAAKIQVALGDVALARGLLASLIERYSARRFHRYADRYRRDLAALDGSS